MNPFAWIIRQPNPWVRCPLLCLLHPLDFVVLTIRMVLDGHGHRLFAFSFWEFNYEIFWVAMEGGFVGLPYPGEANQSGGDNK